jgi:hypothetical protein
MATRVQRITTGRLTTPRSALSSHTPCLQRLCQSWWWLATLLSACRVAYPSGSQRSHRWNGFVGPGTTAEFRGEGVRVNLRNKEPALHPPTPTNTLLLYTASGFGVLYAQAGNGRTTVLKFLPLRVKLCGVRSAKTGGRQGGGRDGNGGNGGAGARLRRTLQRHCYQRLPPYHRPFRTVLTACAFPCMATS